MPSPSLRKALDADLHECNARAGRLSYYAAGEGPPLLLLHSINAAASAYEIKPLFDRFKDSRRVYAPDLPGFGMSDRSNRPYDVKLYLNAVLDMLDAIRAEQPTTTVDALAVSLSAEFLARAARDTPDAWRSVTLVTPTGFRAGSQELRAAEGETREIKALSLIIKAPLWRRALFLGLVRPAVIRYFLRRTYGSNAIDEGLASYCDETTHQEGAEYAPLAFLSGALFSKDIRDVYEALRLPVWLAHGTRGDFKDFSEAKWTETRTNWRRDSFDTGALCYFEKPDAFQAQLKAFLKESGSSA